MAELSKNLPNVQIMGVLNLTPDSFVDGGHYNTLKKAITQATSLISQGANILDVGGESSRPNATIVETDEELKRIIPTIKRLKETTHYSISVDTYKPTVMAKVLALGVDMINDIFALSKRGAIEVCASYDTTKICLMHMQHNPQIMQHNPKYNDIISDIKFFFESRINQCVKAGINEQRLIIDPGFGFGKTLQHNLTILKNLKAFKSFGLPLLVGLSRKSMFAEILGNRKTNDRVIASTIAAKIALENGANIIRTHDALAISDMIKVMMSIYE